MTMKTTIKLTLLAAVGAALLAAPASAQPNHRRQQVQVQHSQQYYPAPGVFRNDTVTEDGQYLGRDPDPNVRSQILKDDSEYNGNGY
jgi:hypothetical protein